MSETEYDFDAATVEIDAKLTSIDACALRSTYDVVDAIIHTDIAEILEHLVGDHQQLEAAELSLAIMRFVVQAGHFEDRLFRTARITVPPRFDIVGSDEELRALENVLDELRTLNAVKEGEGCVRH